MFKHACIVATRCKKKKKKKKKDDETQNELQNRHTRLRTISLIIRMDSRNNKEKNRFSRVNKR